MATKTWRGGSGDFYNASLWTGGAPIFGDTLVASSGTILAIGTEGPASGEFDANVLDLGSNSSSAPAELAATNAYFGLNFFINSGTGSADAEILSLGRSGFAGLLTADANGGTLTISTQPSGSTAGDFVLLNGGVIDISNNDTVVLSGRMDVEGNFDVAPEILPTAQSNGQLGSTFVNDGVFNVISSREKTPTSLWDLAGTGTVNIGIGGVLNIDDISTASQTIRFVSTGSLTGGVLEIDSYELFQSRVLNFLPGDSIIMQAVDASAAYYSAITNTLTILVESEGFTFAEAVYDVTGPTTSGYLQVTPFNTVNGSSTLFGSAITYNSAPSAAKLGIATADEAMGSNIVRATLTTHAGAPIIGTGVTIGIISVGYGSAALANLEALEGFLPLNNGTSAVQVLNNNSMDDTDIEGMAMAELVHQVAPGAAIEMYVATDPASFAAGVSALALHSNIIVDDESNFKLPFFQVAGTDDTAVQNAINAGVDYFTSAANFGNAYYQAAFTPVSTTLPGVSGTVAAQTFSNGSTLQTIVITLESSIALQWDAPFPAANGSTPAAMIMALYQNGTLVATSTQTADPSTGFASEPETFFQNIPTGTYQLAIYQTAGMPSVSLFRYGLYGAGGGTGPGGYIDDPAAMNGAGNLGGYALAPGVNTVAAIDFANTPSFTGDDLLEVTSDNGPGELLFNSSGTRYPTPLAAGEPDITAPDGIYVSPDLTDFQPFYGTSAAAPNAAAVAALMLQANPNLTPAQVTADLEASAVNLGASPNSQGAGLVNAVGAVDLALAAACYAAGTHVLTARGEVPVEHLTAGDVVVTAQGAQREVIWVGHRRVDCRRHPRPDAVWPVRIAVGAFAEDVPHRPLLLSPDHAVYVDDVLIPIKHLINGHSIAQLCVDHVVYWHVELAQHDILLVEGLPAESYLDTGNRAAFDNGAAHITLHPEFARASWTQACARLVEEGVLLRQAKQRLFDRAGLSLAMPKPALQIWARGQRLACQNLGRGLLSFRLPEATASLELHSACWVPAAHLAASLDRRKLGVRIRQIRLDGHVVAWDAPLFEDGFHSVESDGERSFRWTNGTARLSLPADVRKLTIQLDPATGSAAAA